MKGGRMHIVVCGNAKVERKYKNTKKYKIDNFNFVPGTRNKNCTVALPHLIKTVGCNFPDQIKDLLEIASYIYVADRKVKRGTDESIEFHSWSRKLLFKIPVRKPNF